MATLPRIALLLGTESVRWRDVLDVAQRAEELGYDTLWAGETWARDGFAMLGQAATVTSRIRLGTAVVSIFSRTPGMLAQSAASLDEISDGRAVLGLGPSSQTLVEGWHGQRFDRPVARTRELIGLLRGILRGERVDFDGEFYRMHGLSLGFEPPRREIPIYLGALSPRNLELTGELADGWVPAFYAAGHMSLFRGPLETGAARSGRNLDALEIAPWILTCASRDVARARELCREHVAFFVAAYGNAYHDLVCRYGFAEEAGHLKELFRTDRKRLTSGVSDALLDAVSIYGTPEQCRDRYRELFALGVNLPAVQAPARAPRADVWATLEALAPLAF